jgi:L-asparaginase II
MNSQAAPWQPLFSCERDGITELSVSGIIAATAGLHSSDVHVVQDGEAASGTNGKSALHRSDVSKEKELLFVEAGDVDYVLWTRSLLKPFQLASHLEILQQTYPALKPEHYALMSSSHSCEALHLELLREIMAIGRVSPEQLLCPPAWPADVYTREKFRAAGDMPRTLYHNCSGKHFSYLMSLQAQGLKLAEYIEFDNCEHKRLEQLLSRMLGRSHASFPKTTDGCQLPNHAMSVREIAELYRKLAFASLNDTVSLTSSLTSSQALSEALSEAGPDARALATVGNLMHRYPDILGGSNRLDSKIMHGQFTTASGTRFIAKDGADGLLAIGVLPTERFENGLGIVIKLSSGYDIRHMQLLASHILSALGFGNLDDDLSVSGISGDRLRKDHLQTHYDFEISDPVLATGARV